MPSGRVTQYDRDEFALLFISGTGPDRGSATPYPGTPRWVKVAGVVVLALLLLVVALHLAGGGMAGMHGG